MKRFTGASNGSWTSRQAVVFKWFSSKAPELKSPREIGLMREAGKLVARALRICRQMARPGVRTVEIDRAVEAFAAALKEVAATAAAAV